MPSADLVFALDRTDLNYVGTSFQDAEGSLDALSRLHLNDCRPFALTSSFGALVDTAARKLGVEPRALAVRSLLHLPRVASYEGWVRRRQVQRELRINAERLRSDVLAARQYTPVGRFALHELHFEEIDCTRALPVLTSLHYLRSIRQGSLYFALVDPINRLPVTMCSVSPVDWKRVAGRISSHFGIPGDRVWDVSRVYSVDGAPPNAISSLLSKLRTHMRRNISTADLLVTAVDPNLGFTGCSYRAANWRPWMSVKARPYLYQNGHYVTPRQVRKRFGTASFVELQAKYPGIFEQSRVRLLDSVIFCSNVRGETKVVLPKDMHRLRR
jgi:hypothetical protein